jgi:hypothetical protein
MSSKPEESSRQTRGKRLVSLHAVLPTHILEQLTKSAATGGLDSDEEEEAASQPTKDSKRHATVIGKDEGLSSFLSELKSAPTLTFLTGGTAENRPASLVPPLGQAFTTTQTVVVSRTSAKNAEIINVHATTTKKRPEPPAETRQKPFAPEPAGAAPPRPSAFVSVPRPGMNRPIVSAPPLLAMTTEQPRQQQSLFAQYQPELEEETIDPRLAKKKCRKEMEKALRAGNLQALAQGRVTTVEAQGSTFTPQEETYRVPTFGITKVAPVSMYDPKAGSDVVQAGGATGKQRGKHQINTLLASAASLELQRARAIGTTLGGKGKRADAKRKYGW